MALTPNHWTDDFNPFLDHQRRYDEQKSTLEKNCHEKNIPILVERGIPAKEAINVISEADVPIPILKSVLTKNFWRAKLTKVRQSAQERHNRPHWCDIDAAEPEPFETDEGVRLLPKALESVV